MEYPLYSTRLLWLLGHKSWKPTELHEKVAAMQQSGEKIRIRYEQYSDNSTYRVIELVCGHGTVHITLPRGVKHANGEFTPGVPCSCSPELETSQYEIGNRVLTALLEPSDHR